TPLQIKTNAIFYKINDLHIYENPVYYDYYILKTELRMKYYALQNYPSQHLLYNPLFNPDAL
ncbi:hypothetical protein DF186_15175, partial [Enterococcus hirae]